MILIKNVTIITQNPERQIIEKGALLINQDKIEFVGENKKLPKKYFSKIGQAIDGGGKVALPGLINAHTHLAMSLLRGYADDLPLEEWWMNNVYPVESKFGKEEVYWGSLLAMAEMIKSGTTCFADFYYYEDEVAKAAQKAGMRGVLGCGILDVPTFYFENHKTKGDGQMYKNDSYMIKYRVFSSKRDFKEKLKIHSDNLYILCGGKIRDAKNKAVLGVGDVQTGEMLGNLSGLSSEGIVVLLETTGKLR